MKILIKSAAIFLATILVLGPIASILDSSGNIWILAGLVGCFVFIYDWAEKRLSRRAGNRKTTD